MNIQWYIHYTILKENKNDDVKIEKKVDETDVESNIPLAKKDDEVNVKLNNEEKTIDKVQEKDTPKVKK